MMLLLERFIINGWLFLTEIVKSHYYWALGLIAFILIYYLESKLISDEFIEEMRDLL